MKVSLPAPPPPPPLPAPPPDDAPALPSVPPSVPPPPEVVITGAATSALAEACSSSSLSSSLQQGPAILDWARDWVGASSSSSSDEEEEHDVSSDEDDDDFCSHFGNGHGDETKSDSSKQREEEEEEEHETAAVKALVQAAFDGTLAKPVLQRLLGRSSNSNNPAASRRKNSSCLSFLPSSSSKHARPAAEEATQQQQQQHQPPRKRIRRVRVQVHPDSSSSSSNSTSNSSKNMLTMNKLMTPQQLQAALRVSQSAPALVHLNDTDKQLRLQQQHPSRSPPTTTMTMKPDDLLQSLVESAGYTYQTVPALDLEDFFVPVTAESVADYDLELLTAIRSENVPALQQLLAAGKNMQCSNRFGESVVHTACRRGSATVLQFLLQTAQISCKVVCTAGRTALHDALWTSQPNFSVVNMILEACPDLLYVTDQRGFTALQYIRPNQCTAWCDYLRAKAAMSSADNTPKGGGIQQLLPRDLFREQKLTQGSTSSSSRGNKP